MYPAPARRAPSAPGRDRRGGAILLLSLSLALAGCEEAAREAPPPGWEGEAPGAPPPSGEGSEAPGFAPTSDRSGSPPPEDLVGSEVCPTAGYLCHGLLVEGRGPGADPPRIGRWPDGTGTLVVALPPPPVADAARGAALHRGALRGILAWDRHPFPIRVLDRGVDAGVTAHIEVRWVSRLGPGEAGRVRSGWSLRGDDFRFEITDFVLALEVAPPGAALPLDLDPDEVERVAAHEMGHALGLGHSDHPGDLMYPTNTARALSPRDYRTLEALYRLPAGARLILPPG